MVNSVHLKRNRRRYFHVGTYDATIASMYETKSPPHGRERVNSRQLSGNGRKMRAKCLIPHQSSAAQFPTTAPAKSLVAAAWVWSIKPSTFA